MNKIQSLSNKYKKCIPNRKLFGPPLRQFYWSICTSSTLNMEVVQICVVRLRRFEFEMLIFFFIQIKSFHSSDIRISDKILWTSLGMVRFDLIFYAEFKYGWVKEKYRQGKILNIKKRQKTLKNIVHRMASDNLIHIQYNLFALIH